MKKAKVFLAAIGLLAVIGGTVAFRAEYSRGGNLFCTTIYNSFATNQTKYSTTVLVGSGRYCTSTSTTRATLYYSRVTLNL
jgi:hypothetical protein